MSNEWNWPAPGHGKINSGVGARWGTTHTGIDIDAPMNTPVVASKDGTVTRAIHACNHNYGKKPGQDNCGNGYGNHIFIDNGDGYSSRYAHLTTILVKPGDKVKAGQVIGYSGTTGNSTGPHLHFEIRKNNQYLDPTKYVSPNGPTVVPDDVPPIPEPEVPDTNIQGQVDQSLSSSAETPTATGLTVGQRVAGLSKQPMHPFLNIYVGAGMKLLATDPQRPNIIQSFEYQRMEGAGEHAVFTLFDPNWDEIEEVLTANFDQIYIQYGYSENGVKSKLIHHQLQDYSISFESKGTILSFNTVSLGVAQNLQPMNLSLNTYNPTEAAKKICQELGYNVQDENFDSSQDVHSDNPFNLAQDFPLTYITQVIVPQAAKENEEIFVFYLDSDGTAYFKRSSYQSLSTTKTDSMRTYIFQKGYDSSVIDFTCDIKGLFGGTSFLQVGSGYNMSMIGTKDKVQVSSSQNLSSVVTGATGDRSHTSSSQSVQVPDEKGYSQDQMKNILYYRLKSSMPYKATLTIVGDPTIDYIQDRYIRVINLTNEGFLHHTSGVYQITGITDSIQGGKMITSLQLEKNACFDMDGVEILNPHYFIK